jgi:enoyl-CoA hydratase
MKSDNESGAVKTRLDGQVATVTIDNPSRRNALSEVMLKQLVEAFHALQSNRDVRAAILTGEGNLAFASGADIREFGNTAASFEMFRRHVDDAYEAVALFQKPVIAAIRGTCFGGGLALAAKCDIRIAGESSRFMVPPAKLGLAYGYEALHNLVTLIGPSSVKDLIFSARTIESGEALRIGLVNFVVPDEQVVSFALDYAMKVSANAPLTIAAAKAGISSLLQEGKNSDAARELAAMCVESDDFKEGKAAFFEKRLPRFQRR